ncbi:rab-GTPase-TBC domain-containing protein [Entophlyctis helioformis]|nr:rab-GTPase-TBC domain-containing protein [Entophlyctis helioformis]
MGTKSITPHSSEMAFRTKDRLALFELFVGAPNLPPDDDFVKFRGLCFGGIPDSGSIRQRSWMLLLGYLPFYDRSEWPKKLRQQRDTYYTFLRELLHEPTQEELELHAKQRRYRQRQLHLAQHDNDNGNDGSREDDLTYNPGADPKWAAYFEELSILEQIDMDVRRTLPDLAFFHLPIPKSHLSPLHPQDPDADGLVDGYARIKNKRSLFGHLQAASSSDDFGARSRSLDHLSHVDLSSDDGKPAEPVHDTAQRDTRPAVDMHWEAIERILFLYAKLNYGIGYVQGMNEILGPLYYVLANDPDEAYRVHAEADAFYLFTALMSEFRDHFIRSLDNVSRRSSRLSARSVSSLESLSIAVETAADQAQATGIGDTLNRFMRKLHRVDPELYRDMKHKKIEPIFFSFRWLSVLFTQEFPLPDVIRVWDALFADIAVDINDNHVQQYHAHYGSALSLPQQLQLAEMGDGVMGIPERRLHKFEFLIDFACAMVTCVRSELLASSFGDNLKLLQNYPALDIEIIIAQAWEYHLVGDSLGSGRPSAQTASASAATAAAAAAVFQNLFKKATLMGPRSAATHGNSGAAGQSDDVGSIAPSMASSFASVASIDVPPPIRQSTIQETDAEHDLAAGSAARASHAGAAFHLATSAASQDRLQNQPPASRPATNVFTHLFANPFQSSASASSLTSPAPAGSPTPTQSGPPAVASASSSSHSTPTSGAMPGGQADAPPAPNPAFAGFAKFIRSATLLGKPASKPQHPPSDKEPAPRQPPSATVPTHASKLGRTPSPLLQQPPPPPGTASGPRSAPLSHSSIMPSLSSVSMSVTGPGSARLSSRPSELVWQCPTDDDSSSTPL